MAAGILGVNNGSFTSPGALNSGSNTAVVYTCPAGATHAVVHAFFTVEAQTSATTGVSFSSMNVSLQVGSGGGVVYSIQSPSSNSTTLGDGSASVILGPGESISVVSTYFMGVPAQMTSTSEWKATVSGYEVF